MENKLQELTQKLYEEGLSKGRAESEQLITDARQKAKDIVAQAESEAAKIKRDAENAASDLSKNTLTELEIAARQLVGEIKGNITDMIVANATGKSVNDALLDADFTKELLLAVARNWSGSTGGQVNLRAMLPADREAELRGVLENEVQSQLGDGLSIEWSENVKSGLRVAPREGGYYIDFSEDSFNTLLADYLRPKVSEIVFGGTRSEKATE